MALSTEPTEKPTDLLFCDAKALLLRLFLCQWLCRPEGRGGECVLCTTLCISVPMLILVSWDGEVEGGRDRCALKNWCWSELFVSSSFHFVKCQDIPDIQVFSMMSYSPGKTQAETTKEITCQTTDIHPKTRKKKKTITTNINLIVLDSKVSQKWYDHIIPDHIITRW